MQTVTKTFTVYKYDELSDDAKATALKAIASTLSDDWDSFILQEETENLEANGYRDIQIFYSGFFSQGDGASFSAMIDVIPPELVPASLLPILPQLRARITQSGHYAHSNTMDCELITEGVETPITDEQYQDIAKFEDALLSLAKEAANAIYSNLEAEYDYQTSEECLAVRAEENAWLFLGDGSLYV